MEAFAGWKRDNAPRLGAALSYYTLFSLAPLLVIAIAVAGLAFGEQAAQGRLFSELSGLVGAQSASALQQMIAHSRQQRTGIVAGAIALVTLVLGATGVFTELKGALNDVWKVKPNPQQGGVLAMVRDRLVSLAMVMAVGFLLLVSLIVNAALTAAQGLLSSWLPEWQTVLWVFDTVSSFVVITALFALIFKFLPETKITWKDVWVGALLTSALFTAGKQLIGLYLGKSSIASAYGAAGSVVILIVWVYYAAQIFYFGAELTQAYAHRHGSRKREPPGRPAPAS